MNTLAKFFGLMAAGFVAGWLMLVLYLVITGVWRQIDQPQHPPCIGGSIAELVAKHCVTVTRGES